MSYRIIDDGHVSSPKGFRATGVSCGLKEVKARDLAIVYSTRPAHAAAMFTTNAITSAPTFFNQAVLARNREQLRAVVVNAGHANTATGQQGLTNAVDCAKIAAEELEIPRDSILLLSTGKIGAALPMDRMRDGIRRAASELDSGGGRRAATAILTSDTKPKDRALAISLRNGQYVTLAGMAKASRLQAPQGATKLAVLTSDVSIASHLLTHSLEIAVGRSFGRLALDSDSSPNDGIILLANGAAEVPEISDVSSQEFVLWQEALDALCSDLAQQVARDALGGGKLITISVRGAASVEQAYQIGRAVARSTVVRRAIGQGNPDWGSVLIAVGGSGAELRPDLLELRLGSVTVLREGNAVPFQPSAAIQAISGPETEIVIDLHLGTHSTQVLTGISGDIG